MDIRGAAAKYRAYAARYRGAAPSNRPGTGALQAAQQLQPQQSKAQCGKRRWLWDAGTGQGHVVDVFNVGAAVPDARESHLVLASGTKWV